ncbi:MAG: PH domain-containing protein [Parcubacteria group bacterium]|nr:PH domain-containing protein [Parcubacteria group bacterium]
MFKDYFSQDLKDGEEVIRVVRKHWASFIWPVVKTFFILIIPFLLSAFLFSNYIGVIIFFVWVSIGLGYGLYQWICWYFDHFIITDQRIVNIDQKTLFARSVSESGLSNIQDVTYEINGFLASLFNYGTVKVMTASNNDSLEMAAIEKPKEVQETIMELHSKSKKDLSAQELVEFLEQNKDKLIEEKLIQEKKEIKNDFNIKELKSDE